jgi:hypothetical protein
LYFITCERKLEETRERREREERERERQERERQERERGKREERERGERNKPCHTSSLLNIAGGWKKLMKIFKFFFPERERSEEHPQSTHPSHRKRRMNSGGSGEVSKTGSGSVGTPPPPTTPTPTAAAVPVPPNLITQVSERDEESLKKTQQFALSNRIHKLKQLQNKSNNTNSNSNTTHNIAKNTSLEISSSTTPSAFSSSSPSPPFTNSHSTQNQAVVSPPLPYESSTPVTSPNSNTTTATTSSLHSPHLIQHNKSRLSTYESAASTVCGECPDSISTPTHPPAFDAFPSFLLSLSLLVSFMFFISPY